VKWLWAEEFSRKAGQGCARVGATSGYGRGKIADQSPAVMPKPAPIQSIDEVQFTAALDQWLAEQPSRALSLKSLVLRLKPRLVQARAKGMTYQQLATFMAEQGAPCSVSTLKAHLANKRSKKPRAVQRAIGRLAADHAKSNGSTSPRIAPSTARQPGVKGGVTDEEI